MLSLIAVACMLIGNLLALLANNVKRLLAYSSIAHLGYLLVALVAGAALAVEAATYYLVAYFVTTLGAFAIIAALSTAPGEREADNLDDYRGLFWRRPWLAGVFTLMLFSLAGISLTAGFIGKFYIFIAGAEGTLWGLLIILIIGSAIGLYYYLRVVVTMAMPPSSGSAAASPLPPASGVVLLALTLLLLGLGVYPTPLLNLIRTTTLSLLL
jgi:NADH-quinone oxidoreductase subunit N